MGTGCKDGLDTDQMGHPLAQNGAALAPFRAKGVIFVLAMTSLN